jgi:hypothetical protein
MKCAGCWSTASAKKECPTCKENGVSACFCSQACFKGKYKKHKQLHLEHEFKGQDFLELFFKSTENRMVLAKKDVEKDQIILEENPFWNVTIEGATQKQSCSTNARS